MLGSEEVIPSTKPRWRFSIYALTRRDTALLARYQIPHIFAKLNQVLFHFIAIYKCISALLQNTSSNRDLQFTYSISSKKQYINKVCLASLGIIRWKKIADQTPSWWITKLIMMKCYRVFHQLFKFRQLINQISVTTGLWLIPAGEVCKWGALGNNNYLSIWWKEGAINVISRFQSEKHMHRWLLDTGQRESSVLYPNYWRPIINTSQAQHSLKDWLATWADIFKDVKELRCLAPN